MRLEQMTDLHGILDGFNVLVNEEASLSGF